MIVLDASLLISWLLSEPSDGPEDAISDIISGSPAFVPNHWPNEIANALRKAVRTKRLKLEEIPPIAARVGSLDIAFAGPLPIDQIAALAIDALDHRLSAYDMIYIRLAREHQLPLATLDGAMRKAAGRMKIPLLPA